MNWCSLEQFRLENNLYIQFANSNIVLEKSLGKGMNGSLLVQSPVLILFWNGVKSGSQE